MVDIYNHHPISDEHPTRDISLHDDALDLVFSTVTPESNDLYGRNGFGELPERRPARCQPTLDDHNPPPFSTLTLFSSEWTEETTSQLAPTLSVPNLQWSVIWHPTLNRQYSGLGPFGLSFFPLIPLTKEVNQRKLVITTRSCRCELGTPLLTG